MIRQIARLFLMGVLAIGFQALVAGPASAHYLTVTATASCSADGIPAINYTAISWDLVDFAGENPEIDILFNGVKVDSEPFMLSTSPPNQFSGQKPAPSATTSVDVEGIAVGTWLDGELGGQTSTVTVAIPTDCSGGTGRFTGGGKQVIVGDVTITKGFEVDCDLHEPSENLEINWSDAEGAHQFHLEDLTSAVCTLNGNPVPPKAPVNTIVASGTGRYDGVDGYNITFTLIDNGEPGKGVDEAGFEVFSGSPPPPGTGDVLNVPLSFITTGNIQAHVDQR